MTATSSRIRAPRRRLLQSAVATLAALLLLAQVPALADEHTDEEEEPPPPPPPAVTLIVPITLTPADGALLTATELEEATAEEGMLTSTLDAVEYSAAVLAIDPSIPAAIRVLGSAAPDSASDWLSRLESLPNERFALQFGDADVTAQAQAGLPEILEAPALTSYLNPDNFADTPRQPSIRQLSHIRGSTPSVLWPRGNVRTEDLAVFDEYLDAAALTLLPGGNEHARIAGHSVVLYDQAASELWGRVASASDTVQRSALLSLATALLPDTGSLVIGLPRDEERSGEALSDVVTALSRHGTWLSLSELGAQAPVLAELTEEIDEERADAVIALMSDETALATFSSILDVPAALNDRTRLRLLRTLGVKEPDAGFTAAVDASRQRTQTTLESVRIEPSSDVQILSPTVDLPVGVRNDLQWPVTITIIAQSGDTRLDVQRNTTVTIPAQTSERARVPVHARVASGDVDVRLRLVSAEGITIGEPTETHVKVRAEWERIGISVLAGVVTLLFVFGVIRTVRRKRRAQTPDAIEVTDE